ncbi:TonB-dependent receptor domain-containing protein, partial [Salmonella enterica]|uniref:TonB-dependent receptor domain-containing protein n=1 Tax=Salmonella enterica TaxID=28901 RepID=UPI00398C256F
MALDHGDNSDAHRSTHWLPAVSLKYAFTDAWTLYLASRRGFETRTSNELCYRAHGQRGFNFHLKPSTSDTFEVGCKTRLGNP